VKLSAVLKPRRETDPVKYSQPFRDALVAWFRKNGRDYPWRRTRDPYAVLVSEVMLQQTQIATVLGKGYYTRFLDAFPDAETLAMADDDSLLKAWEGLGYYRRARMLRDTARALVEKHGGRFPKELADLLELPGVGRYTAGALRAFAFAKPAVLVDGNVSRVISRLTDFSEPVDEPAGIRRIWEWAETLADDRHPREYHSALMELGQTVCRTGTPDCLSCPVARFCATRRPELLPVKKRKTVLTEVTEHALWLRDGTGRLLLHQEAGKRRTGLWKLPLRDAGELAAMPLLAEHRYGITRYRVTLRVHQGDASVSVPVEGDTWIDSREIPGLAMAAPFRKVVERLIEDF
jgi:A/G-specific adenine glycosylase